MYLPCTTVKYPEGILKGKVHPTWMCESVKVSHCNSFKSCITPRMPCHRRALWTFCYVRNEVSQFTSEEETILFSQQIIQNA